MLACVALLYWSDTATSVYIPAMSAAMPTLISRTVASSSMSVSPRSPGDSSESRVRPKPRDTSDVLVPLEHAVHRRDEGHGHEADDRSHEDDDRRLEQVGEPLELELELACVIRRRGVHLGVERASLLAYPDHLDGR